MFSTPLLPYSWKELTGKQHFTNTKQGLKYQERKVLCVLLCPWGRWWGHDWCGHPTGPGPRFQRGLLPLLLLLWPPTSTYPGAQLTWPAPASWQTQHTPQSWTLAHCISVANQPGEHLLFILFGGVWSFPLGKKTCAWALTLPLVFFINVF